MAVPILTTKLYIPKPHADLVVRPRLLKLMSDSVQRGSGLTLISALTGFGKTALVGQWIPHSQHCVAWLSLEAGDNDLPRFLRYFIAALQSLEPNLGQAALSALQSPQPPPVESLLGLLLVLVTRGQLGYRLDRNQLRPIYVYCGRGVL